MERLTLDMLFWIIGMAVAAVIVVSAGPSILRALPGMGAALLGVVNYFVEVRRINHARYVESEEANAPPDQAFEAVQEGERSNDGSPDTNAGERAFGGSRTVHEPENEPAFDAHTLGIMQRIAAHKLRVPTAPKAETIYTLFGAKKGSSARYQECSEAWDLLYPSVRPIQTADDPDAWQPGERPGQLVRVK